MKKPLIALVLAVCVAIPLKAFDFKLTWDIPAGYVASDQFDTNNSVFASYKGFNVYRGTTPTTFILYTTVGPTNFVSLTNQPQSHAYFYVTSVAPDGMESAPSNTNHVVTPLPLINPLGVKGSR